jgi:hypothetical protein
MQCLAVLTTVVINDHWCNQPMVLGTKIKAWEEGRENTSVEYWRSALATESDPLPEHPMERPMPTEEEAQVEALEEEKDEADAQQNSDTKDRK